MMAAKADLGFLAYLLGMVEDEADGKRAEAAEAAGRCLRTPADHPEVMSAR